MPLPFLLVCFLLIFELYQEFRNSLLHAALPTATRFPLCCHVLFLSLEKVTHENQPSVLVHSSHQDCIPLLGNPLTGQSLLSSGCDFVISLFPPPMILNSTHPTVFAAKTAAHIQLLYRSPCLNIRSTGEFLLVGLLITCIRSCHQSTPAIS